MELQQINGVNASLRKMGVEEDIFFLKTAHAKY